MKDPYALIRELIFLYKGKPKDVVIDAVLKAFKDAYKIYLPDFGVPYEELAYYIQRGSEDEAYEWIDQYLADYLLRELEYEQRMEEEKARDIGEKILNFLRQKRIKTFGVEDPEKVILKIIEDYDKLSKKYRELQQELTRLKKKYAEAESKFEKTKSPTDLKSYLETAKAVEEQTKKLREELERLKKENEELRRKLLELSRVVPEVREIKPLEIERVETEIRRKEEEIKREISLYERLKETIPTTSTQLLIKLYQNLEKMYPGYSPEEYRKARELIEKELEFRGVKIKEILGRTMEIPPIQRFVAPEIAYIKRPTVPPPTPEIQKTLEAIAKDLENIGLLVPNEAKMDPVVMMKFLLFVASNYNIPAWIRDRALQYYHLLRIKGKYNI